MNKWNEKIFGELGFTYAGLSGKTQKDFGKGKPYIPFMNIMANGKINPKFLNYVDVLENEHQNAVQKGDLFFTTSSETPEEVGMTSVLLDDIGECYLNSFCFGFRLYNYDDLIPDYAPYLFRGNKVRKQIINLGQGYTRFNLPKTELLKKLTLNLPPLPEQQKILEILTSVDSIIEKTQAAIAKYKAIKQGMLHDLFTRGIDLQTGKLRPRYADAPELYKESKLGWIPREWEEIPLENLCIGKPSYGINAPAVEFSYQLPTYLRITDIDDEGKFIKDGRKSVDSPFSGEYILNEGDLVFARTGATVGKTYLYNINDGVLVYAGFLIKVTPNNSLLNSKYLKSFTETSYYKNWVELMSQRSAQPGINGNEYGKQLIPKPEIEEQEIIAERIISIDNKLQTEQSYLQKMQQLKKGLMEDLLSGRKRVNVPDK